MRILYQHRTLADGAEGIHIQEIIEAFEKLGHQVTLHALASSTMRGVGQPSIWSSVKALLPGGLFEVAAMVYNVVDYIRLRSEIRGVDPDVIYKRHAHFDIGVALAARRAGVPVILEANAAYSSAANQKFERVTFKWLSRRFERVSVRQSVLVVAVSTPMAENLRALSDRPCDVIVVPNGANPERFFPRADRGAEIRKRFDLQYKTVIGWSGILRHWHRVDLLLEAVAALPDSVVLLIIGDGPDRARLQARAAALGVASRVRVTGRVPHAEVPAYVSSFDIAVAPHDGTGYASPMKVLEYMAMGLPVVAPRMRNIGDIIEDGRDGLLFTPEDLVSLTEALRCLINDASLRAELGAAARQKVERERNWISNARRILDEFRVRWSALVSAVRSTQGQSQI